MASLAGRRPRDSSCTSNTSSPATTPTRPLWLENRIAQNSRRRPPPPVHAPGPSIDSAAGSGGHPTRRKLWRTVPTVRSGINHRSSSKSQGVTKLLHSQVSGSRDRSQAVTSSLFSSPHWHRPPAISLAARGVTSVRWSPVPGPGVTQSLVAVCSRAPPPMVGGRVR